MEQTPPSDYKRFKVAFVGDPRVGKSSLIDRINEKDFKPERGATVGCDLFGRFFVDRDNNRMWIEIWDTVGEDRMMDISPQFIRNSAVVIVVFSLGNKASFDACGKWIEMIREKLGRPRIILVGNQFDLKSRAIQSRTAQLLALDHAACYLETSAKTGHNIAELISQIVQSCAHSDCELGDRRDIIDVYLPEGSRCRNDSPESTTELDHRHRVKQEVPQSCGC